LSLINPNDNLPVETFCSYYNKNLLFVPHDTSLIKMLQEFIKGKSHLAFVYKRSIKIKQTEETNETNETASSPTEETKNNEIISSQTLDDLLNTPSHKKSIDSDNLVKDSKNRKTILKMGSMGDSGIFLVSSNEDTEILNAAVKKIIGIVTLEDVFEVIIQQEIFDEKDLDRATSKKFKTKATKIHFYLIAKKKGCVENVLLI
jgi:metal transporter CNNM